MDNPVENDTTVSSLDTPHLIGCGVGTVLLVALIVLVALVSHP